MTTTTFTDVNSPEGAAALLGGAEAAPDATETLEASPAKTAPAKPAPVAAMSEETLKDRLARERKVAEERFYKEHYGTTDPAKIAEIKAKREAESKELERLKRAEETRQKARLTEQQRLEQDLKKRDEEINQLREQLKAQKRTIVAEKQEAVISGLVKGKVRDERMKFFRSDLAAHIRGLTPEKQKAFNAKSLERFVNNYLEEYPEFAVPATPPAKTTEEVKPTSPPPRAVRPATTGAKVPAPRAVGKPEQTPTKDGSHNGKTPLPGRPNSMTKSELREHYRKLGKPMPY